MLSASGPPAVPNFSNAPSGAFSYGGDTPFLDLGGFTRENLVSRSAGELASMFDQATLRNAYGRDTAPNPIGGFYASGPPADWMALARSAEIQAAQMMQRGIDPGANYRRIYQNQQNQPSQQADYQAEIQRQASEEQAALQMAQRGQIERQFAGNDERIVQQGINRGFAGQFSQQPTLQQGRGGSYIPNLIRRGKSAFQQALASIGASDTDAGIPINSGGSAPASATAFASPTDYGYSGTTGSAPVETSAPPPAWGGLGVFYGGG